MAETHKLKIQPEYFEAVSSKKKSFEIRENDRDFEVGDWLILQEFIPDTKEFTGKEVVRRITYITDYAQQENFVVMAII